MLGKLIRDESDEDQLRLQEEFDKDVAEKKIQVTGTVVCGYQKPEKMEIETPGEADEEIQERLGNAFMDLPKNVNVGPVIERKRGPYQRAPQNSSYKYSQKTGFPQAMRRDVTLSAKGGVSIFAQQMRKLKDVNIPTTSNETKMECVEEEKKETVFDEKRMSIDREQIHKDNMDLLSQMSQEEILAERENLMSTMDPAILAYMKSKRFHTKEPVETRQPSIAEQNKAVESLTCDDLQSTKEILDQPESDKWLNFDVLETNKLAWLQDVDVPKITKDSPYEARFDFDGWLLPFTNDGMTESNRALYHHGEEPGRPGYTLQELFQLCRSNVMQQKVVALNTIANILGLQASGIYDEVIEIPIEQIFFFLRFALDDNTPAVLNASIKAMRNLFYHPIDETCLDNLWSFGMGIVQPILAIDNEEKNDDKTVNDQQLVETNLIKCLMRSDILIRIRYILSTVKPCLETMTYCLELLTRLARDSDFVVMQIWECPGLLQTVITDYAPNISNNKNRMKSDIIPIAHTLKFLRVLSARSRNFAVELIEKYQLLNSLLSYLFDDPIFSNANGKKLQIEALRLWSSFVRYGLAIDTFKEFQPVLWSRLNYHVKNTDLASSYTTQAHLSALLILISEVVKHDFDYITVYYDLIINRGATKWLSQITTLQRFTSGKMQIASSLFVAMTNYNRFKPNDANLHLDFLTENTVNLIDSQGFNLITEDIKLGSNLLNNYETHKCGANFNYTEAPVWNTSDHIIPILKTNSCIPFIRAFANFVESTGNKQLITKFLSNDKIMSYLKQIQMATKYYLTNNWYTRVESSLLISILKMAIKEKQNVDTGMFYEIAMKTLSVYHEEQKPDVEFVIKNAIFSPEFYPPDVFLNGLRIADDAEDMGQETFNITLTNLDDIFNVYKNVLGLKKLKVEPMMQSVEVKIGNALPVDWIYSPIIILYANQLEDHSTMTEEVKVIIVTNCLRWVYICETYFPSLANLIDPTDRFCRLACIYFDSDRLFLIPDVNNLLKLCLKSVLMSGSKFNFDRTIHGLNNFQDFFTSLLEEYQGVNYGDALFDNFILIPLAQRHNIKYRKTVWSEYAGVVQVFNLTEKDIIVPIESFLEPEETDMSLLHCYRRVLMSRRIRTHSVLYKIAKHHWDKFIARRTAEKGIKL